MRQALVDVCLQHVLHWFVDPRLLYLCKGLFLCFLFDFVCMASCKFILFPWDFRNVELFFELCGLGGYSTCVSVVFFNLLLALLAQNVVLPRVIDKYSMSLKMLFWRCCKISERGKRLMSFYFQVSYRVCKSLEFALSIFLSSWVWKKHNRNHKNILIPFLKDKGLTF